MAVWIEVATQAWGQLVRPGTNAPLSNGVPQINTTVRATASDTGTVIAPADWKSDKDGLLPGFVAEGTWLFIEPDGQSRQVEAISGGTSGRVASLESSQATQDARIAVLREGPINALSPPGALVAAVGDGVADDSVALQAILDALKASGGGMLLPRGKVFSHATTLNGDGIVAANAQGGTEIFGPGAVLRYTGAGAAGLTLKGSQHVTVRDLMVEYTNAAFAGNLIQARGAGAASGADAAYLRVIRCALGGTTTATGARSLVNLNQAISSKVESCKFNRATNCVWLSDGSYSVANTIEDCVNGLATITESVIRNPSESTRIIGNTFEGLFVAAGQDAKPGAILGDAGITIFGLQCLGNWYGDAVHATAAGHWIRLNGVAVGVFISDRLAAPGAAPGNSAVNFAAGGEGLTVVGSRFDAGGAGQNGIMFGAASRGVAVSGNDLSGLATPLSGTANILSGYALGNDGVNDRIFGDANMGIGIDPAHRLHVNGVVKTAGVITHTSGGALSDAQFATVADGMIAVDTFNNRLAVRIGGVWKYVTVA